jgi:hypothetical protein
MVLRAKGLDHVDVMAVAKSPQTKRNDRIETAPQRKRHKTSSDLARFCENLSPWVAPKPCLVAVLVEPIYFQAGAIFLSAPAAAALEKKKIHCAA